MMIAGLLAFALQARAADPKCSVESLGLCSVYNEPVAKIEYPDKTFLPNFRTLARPATVNFAAEEVSSLKRSNADVDAHTARSARAMSVLSTVQPPLSPSFIYYASGHLLALKYLLNSDEIVFTWPAIGESKMQKLAKGQATSWVNALPTDVLKQLNALADQEAVQSQEQWTRVAGSFSDSGAQLIHDMNSVTDQRYQHVEALFEEMKTYVQSVIRHGKADSALTDQEKAAIAKVGLIRMNPNRVAISEKPGCLGIETNAFYNVDSHQVNLCPSLFNYPDATVAMTIAHEIGHSIDVCFSQAGVFKVNEELAKRLKDDSSVQADNSKFQAISYVLENSGRGLSADFLTKLMTPSQFSYLQQAGVVQRQVAESPFSTYIFKDVYQCLIMPRGGGFRAQSPAQLQRSIDDVIAQRRASAGRDYNAASDRTALEAAFASSPECRLTNNSQMQEVMADWIGQSAQDLYLKKHALLGPFKTAKDKMSLVGVPASFACLDQIQPQRRNDQDASPIGLMAHAERTLTSAKDPHPLGVKRVDELILRDPVIRSALGCTANAPAPPCEHHVSTADAQPSSRDARSAKGVQ